MSTPYHVGCRKINMNWNQRYATSKVPSKCIFCNGSSHYFKTAREVINEDDYYEGRGTEGFPRKFWTETNSNFRHMKPMPKYAPVPYTQYPTAEADEEYGMKAIAEHRCVFCGVPFKRDETVTRFTDSSPNVDSLQPAEYFPMHEKCMSTTRRFCPGLYNHPDEHFETGPYEQLRANAEKQVGPINKKPKPIQQNFNIPDPVKKEDFSSNAIELINKLLGK